MDFRQRVSERPSVAASSNNAQATTANPPENTSDNTKKLSGDMLLPRWVRIASVVLVFSIAILIVGVASFSYLNRAPQFGFVKKNNEQAVFLNNGQVYFGKITAINPSFFDLQNIFYLNTPSTSTGSSSSTASTSSSSLSLVKLGCEIHAPLDQMIINSQQVSFWENLSPNGKVAQAITKWENENPNGQTCTTTSSSAQQSTGTTQTTTGTDDTTK